MIDHREGLEAGTEEVVLSNVTDDVKEAYRFAIFAGVRRADCQEDAPLDVQLRALNSTNCPDLYLDEGPWVNPEGAESAQAEDVHLCTGVCDSLGDNLRESCYLAELRLAARVSLGLVMLRCT